MDSATGQSQENIEILIVDDGSSDNTIDIAREYAARDTRIRLLVNDRNLGLVGNWNRCIGLSGGQWIKFVFQDDMIAPDCIERMLNATGSGIALVASSRNFLFAPDTEPEVRDWYIANRDLVEGTWGGARRITSHDFCEATLNWRGANLVGEPTSVLLNREALKRYGPFNSALIMSCDLEYWTRIGVDVGFAWIQDRLATFRVHGGATSAENRSSRMYRMNVLDDLILLHEFTFSPSYAKLRKAATSRTPPVNLAAAFYKQAKWAWRLATKAENESPNDARSPLQEWDAVAQRYPRIAAIAKPIQQGWGARVDEFLRFFRAH